MGTLEYTIEDYKKLLGHDVEFCKLDSNKIYKGLVEALVENGNFVIIKEKTSFVSSISSFAGNEKKSNRVKIPVSYILESSFKSFKRKAKVPQPTQYTSTSFTANPPRSSEHYDLHEVSKKTFMFGIDSYTLATESKLKIGSDVVWMLPNHLLNASNPYIGQVELVASRETGNGLTFRAIVEFHQGTSTSSLSNYIGPPGRNRNFIPVEELMLVEEWRKTLVANYGNEVTLQNSIQAPPSYGWAIPSGNKVSNEQDASRSRSRSNLSLKHAASQEPLRSPQSKNIDRDNKRCQTVSRRETKKGPAVHKPSPIGSEMWMNVINIDLLSKRLNRKRAEKGANYGIQGQLNSCYMDVSIFCMFAFTNAFDDFVKRDKSADGEGLRHTVKKILRRDIVETLRENYFVPWQNMNNLRAILVQHVNQSYQKSCMDVEEFMLELFNLINAPKLFKYDDGEMDYIHQIILPNDWNESKKVKYMCVQELLVNSFHTSEVCLNEQPERALVIKLPVSDGKLIPCQGVIPNLTIKVPKKANGSVEMHLHAIICLRHSHFVAFVRADANDLHQRWVFMNSNPVTSAPEVKVLVGINEKINEALQNISTFSSEEPHCDGSKLFRDAYICIYLP